MQIGRQTLKQSKALVSCQTTKFSSVTMAEEESKHRMKLALYDLVPYIENCWIAPNSTVIGEVNMMRFASVWYNSVVRGDINAVK